MDAECRINGIVLPQLHCSLYTCVVENVCEVLILQVDIIQLHIWKGIWDFQVLVVPEGVLGDRHSDQGGGWVRGRANTFYNSSALICFRFCAKNI